MTTLTFNQATKLLGVGDSGLKRWLLDDEMRRDYFPGAKKINGRWVIPLVDATALKQRIDNGHDDVKIDMSKLPPGDAFTLKEVSEHTGVSVITLRWIRKRGDFPNIYLADPKRIAGPHNPWLIPRTDLERAVVPQIGRAAFGFIGEKESARLYLECSQDEARAISDRLTPRERYLALAHFAGMTGSLARKVLQSQERKERDGR